MLYYSHASLDAERRGTSLPRIEQRTCILQYPYQRVQKDERKKRLTSGPLFCSITRTSSNTATHVGRGGAANVIKNGDAETPATTSAAAEKPKAKGGLLARIKQMLSGGSK